MKESGYTAAVQAKPCGLYSVECTLHCRHSGESGVPLRPPYLLPVPIHYQHHCPLCSFSLTSHFSLLLHLPPLLSVSLLPAPSSYTFNVTGEKRQKCTPYTKHIHGRPAFGLRFPSLLQIRLPSFWHLIILSSPFHSFLAYLFFCSKSKPTTTDSFKTTGIVET